MKKLVVMALMALSCLTFAGCANSASSNSGNEVYVSEVLFTVQGYDVSVEEFNHYLLQTLSCYQIQSPQMSEETKNNFIADTAEDIWIDIILEKMAIEAGTTLTDDEKKSVNENMEMFVSYYGDTILRRYHIDQMLVGDYFNRRAIISAYEKSEVESRKDKYLEQLKDEVSPERFCSFDIITFNSEEDANAYKASIEEDDYQKNIDALAEFANYEIANEQSVYDAYEGELLEAITGLANGQVSDVFIYNEKNAVVVMKNSADEELYNQTMEYAAIQAAKQEYTNYVNEYIEKNNLTRPTVQESQKELVDPQYMYEDILNVEQMKQMSQ